MKYPLALVFASSTILPFISAQETLPEDLRATIEEDSTEIQVSYVGDASDGFDDATVFTPDGKLIASLHGLFSCSSSYHTD